ncbi:carbohydrate ABC transporter permease, partial [Streptomyces sp. SID7760]|nr:carbohydrate ABC transporter permease [Streptomyces sp. SID7760]
MTAESTAIKAPGEAAAERSGGGAGPGQGAKRGSDGMVLNVFSHGFLAVWAILIVLPLIWLALGSFKTDAQIGGSALSWPSHWHFDAFSRAWDKGIGDYF